jgi:hypothetical protein
VLVHRSGPYLQGLLCDLHVANMGRFGMQQEQVFVQYAQSCCTLWLLSVSSSPDESSRLLICSRVMDAPWTYSCEDQRRVWARADRGSSCRHPALAAA